MAGRGREGKEIREERCERDQEKNGGFEGKRKDGGGKRERRGGNKEGGAVRGGKQE